jgi:hypothetical protein
MSQPTYDVTIEVKPDGADTMFQFVFTDGQCVLSVEHDDGRAPLTNTVAVEDLVAFQNACYAMRELLLGVR